MPCAIVGSMAFPASKVTLRFFILCKVDIRSLGRALTVGTGASTSNDLPVMAASMRYEVLGLFGISSVIAAPAQNFESPPVLHSVDADPRYLSRYRRHDRRLPIVLEAAGYAARQ
jgi:hypothetical protein